MSFAAWAYFLFTVALAAVFAWIVVHYFSSGRRDLVEAPKHRMLSDDPEPPGAREENGREGR